MNNLIIHRKLFFKKKKKKRKEKKKKTSTFFFEIHKIRKYLHSSKRTRQNHVELHDFEKVIRITIMLPYYRANTSKIT